ncbi:hypothetical protein QJS66_01230 [Kocuria rhizophila]|nr:hypothetical protein QJS66_01230 [Kocuria rhizophila]
MPGVPEHLAQLSDAAGLDLAHYGTEADEEHHQEHRGGPPLIVAAGLLAGRLIAPQLRDAPTWCSPDARSVEITAAALAGVLTEAEAMRFVRVRATRWPPPPRQPPPAWPPSSAAPRRTWPPPSPPWAPRPQRQQGAVRCGAAAENRRAARRFSPRTRPPAPRWVRLKVAGAFQPRAHGPRTAATADPRSRALPRILSTRC